MKRQTVKQGIHGRQNRHCTKQELWPANKYDENFLTSLLIRGGKINILKRKRLSKSLTIPKVGNNQNPHSFTEGVEIGTTVLINNLAILSRARHGRAMQNVPAFHNQVYTLYKCLFMKTKKHVKKAHCCIAFTIAKTMAKMSAMKWVNKLCFSHSSSEKNYVQEHHHRQISNTIALRGKQATCRRICSIRCSLFNFKNRQD